MLFIVVYDSFQVDIVTSVYQAVGRLDGWWRVFIYIF